MQSRYRGFRHLPHPYAIWSDKRESCDHEDMLHRVLVLEVLLQYLFSGSAGRLLPGCIGPWRPGGDT
ncbi:hypothetical protein [Methylotetracoccus oryzae]|uniref:hypothetical protein n=1 Tax=Methylotetracoccus oryzae TaxID=1919059 RepID=UPI00111A83C4|nr:hypothetical protein [Methylotetracoccus oryzae]